MLFQTPPESTALPNDGTRSTTSQVSVCLKSSPRGCIVCMPSPMMAHTVSLGDILWSQHRGLIGKCRTGFVLLRTRCCQTDRGQLTFPEFFDLYTGRWTGRGNQFNVY
jgi:hypothetical protein